MITDTKGIIWTPNEDRSAWTSSDGARIVVNPTCNNEQVLSCINSLYVKQVPQKTDSERIAELEAQVQQLLSKTNT